MTQRHRARARAAGVVGVAAVALACPAAPASADPVADFYRGKTITLTVGTSPGGGYDTYARMIARHMSRHIPGEPGIVVKNNPGAGGLVLANTLYKVAAKDGTEFGTFNRSLVLDPLFGNDKAQYDPLRFTWLGSPANEVSTCVAYRTSGIRTVEDLKQRDLVVGALSATTDSAVYPNVSNALIGTRFKVVTGYSGGAAAILAMERGETQGFCGWAWSSMEAQRPGWYKEGRINVLLQYGITANPAFKGVPLAVDLTRSPRDRQKLEIVVAPQLFARPYMAPPDVPPERARALQVAFARTLADPDFLKEAAERRLDVEPVSAQAVVDLLKRVYGSPKEIIDEVKKILK